MFPSASRSCLKSSIRLFPTMITASIKAGITKNAKPMNNPKINRKESTIANGLLRNRIFLLFGKSFFSIGRMGTLKMRASARAQIIGRKRFKSHAKAAATTSMWRTPR